MTLLDIPLPDGALTRPQVSVWAEKVYDAFVNYISRVYFYGHETPSENDPKDWEGDYEYESMSVADKVALLTRDEANRNLLISEITDSIIAEQISDDLGEMFSEIVQGFQNYGQVDHFNKQQVHHIIMDALFGYYEKKYNFNSYKHVDGYKSVPKAGKKEYKYFYEQFYQIIDVVLECTLRDLPEQIGILGDERLYRAEKAGKLCATTQREEAQYEVQSYIMRSLEEKIKDMKLHASTNSFVNPMFLITLNHLYEMMPTSVTTEMAKRMKILNSDMTKNEAELDRLIFDEYRSQTLNVGRSPAYKQLSKSYKFRNQQTQITPGYEPYEAPQLCLHNIVHGMALVRRLGLVHLFARLLLTSKLKLGRVSLGGAHQSIQMMMIQWSG